MKSSREAPPDMQDRYAGDIGDYLKFALLRALPEGARLAIGWCLPPDEGHNDDGRHVGYLAQPDRWRQVDPGLFGALGQMVGAGARSVAEIEGAALFPRAAFHSTPVPFGPRRREGRLSWIRELHRVAADSDILFLDPDNGIDVHA